MNKSISLTVDTDDYNALTRASDMLHGMAQDVKKDKGCTSCISKEEIVKTEIPAVPAKPENSNSSLEGAADMGTETPASPAAIIETPAAPAATTTPVGVELDSEGLPWDGRIHGAKKLKLAKDQTWKKIRGIDLTLVATVEAELRQVMAIPASIETETPAAPAIVETPAAPAIVETPAAPAAIAETSIITFPDLMGAITKAIGDGVHTNETITAVINKHGLASLPLISARPDLIPAIAAELFPNG